MTILVYEPTLRLAFSDDPSFRDEEYAKATASPAGDPLAIEEWQTYFVKFYGDSAPPSLQQAQFVVRQIQPCLWELNFRNFVGLSRIGDLKLVIQNKKISNELYHTLLDELAGYYATLVFDFGSPVGQHYKKSGVGKDSAFVEYLFLCKSLLHESPDLDAISDILVYDPHRKLEKECRRCSIEECQNADIGIVHALINSPMARLRDGHPLQQTHLGKILKAKTGQEFYPTKASKEIKYLTVDTHENRFVKFFLRELLAKVESLYAALGSTAGSYFNPDISENLELLRKKIGKILAQNMWREVGEMRFLPVSSQVLQRKDGYRHLFRLYSLLQLATYCDFLETDFKNLVEIKDVPTIYEYWCFFQIKAIMDSLTPISKVSRIIDQRSLTYTLSPGLCIDYACGSQLFFNKNYEGSTGLRDIATAAPYAPEGDSYSHTLRPDIVIVQNGQKLIFDAKYKGKRKGFYCEGDDGTIQRWRDEDIDKMHTYREAIKGVTGSYILYPGTQDIMYPRHAGGSLIEGVGALSLRPGTVSGKDGSDTSHIQRIISIFLGKR